MVQVLFIASMAMVSTVAGRSIAVKYVVCWLGEGGGRGGILIRDPPTPGASDNNALVGNIPPSGCSQFLLCNMRE